MIQKLYRWYGRKKVWAFFAVVLLILAIGLIKIVNHTEATPEIADTLPTVQTALVGTLAGESSLTIIGSVEAINEARLETEASGRITDVRIAIGDSVTAGSIVAKIENASQYASLLQAEGSYEIALAAAAQSDVSALDAETSLIATQNAGLNTYRSAFTTTDSIIRNFIDDFFTNPEESNPEFLLDGLGFSLILEKERQALETMLDSWASTAHDSQKTETTVTFLVEAEADVRRVSVFVEDILEILSHENNENIVINGSGVEAYKTEFLGARTSLNATLLSITTAHTAIENAEEGLARAKISGTNTDLSVANAQVKQALGSLRAAQASYAKTIVRTPISGTVNKVNIQAGDFVGMFNPVATIANNNALEITAYVGEVDRDRLTIGDAVLIENLYTGSVTKIAPAIDPVTKKVEIKIQTESDALANGDTVRVAIQSDMTKTDRVEVIRVPLTAVKFSANDGSVFTVVDGLIVAHPVTLGAVSGANIEITDGVSSDMEIIIDARGLSVGQRVESVTN